jgi:hypothetical protein
LEGGFHEGLALLRVLPLSLFLLTDLSTDT